MKILYVTNANMDQVLRGQDAHSIELINNLEKLGNEVTVIGVAMTENIKVNNFYNVNVPLLTSGSEIINFFYQTIFMLKAFLYTLKLARGSDILYVRDPISGFVVAIPNIIFKKKMIFEVNGLVSLDRKIYKATMLNRSYTKFLRVLESVTLRVSDGIISVTAKIKDILVKEHKMNPHKIAVIGNGVNTELFHPIEDQEILSELKKELGIKKEDYVVGFVGNFAPWQGVEYVIESAPIIIKEIPNTKFLIVGEGYMKDRWLKRIRELNLVDNFIFPGRASYEKIPEYINIFDISVTLKRVIKTGFSTLKFYEYLACGKPIIATDTSGFEVIMEKKLGLLVNPKDSMDLSKAVIKLLRDKKLRSDAGKNARKVAVEEYEWREVVKRIDAVCKDTLSAVR